MRKPRWWSAFIAQIETGKSVIAACTKAEISPTYVYRLRKSSSVKGVQFKAAWEAAEERFQEAQRQRCSR